MNKIGPDGVATTDIFNDFSIFSLNNINIGQYAAKILQGSNNTILGQNAGKLAVKVNNSIFLGNDAGISVLNGTNNISIGSENSSL